ncbi:protein takeout-like [Battus philenor]|uniref:protein takeout-like n=1 Tax=Battus philenor TaxID=42288 RepID=UPI0035D08AED
MLVVFALLGAVCVTEGALAPFIRPCYADDIDCLIDSTQAAVPVVAAGVPEFGMQSLDPMTLDRVVANQAGLDMDFRNTVVKGLRNCQVLNVVRFPQRTQLDVQCSVTLVGDYRLGGQLLILPIEGQGRYKIKIRDIVVNMDFEVGERLDGGESFWTVENWWYTADVLTNVEFRFQNLFNGNRQLASAVQDFANENWRDIFQELSPPFMDVIVSKIIDELRKLFDIVPISEMTLN